MAERVQIEEKPDGCMAFGSPGIGKNTLTRFIVGADPAPRKMTSAEVAALGDPFATLVLAKGKFPQTAERAVELIKAAVPKNDPLTEQSTFVVGEGSQLNTPERAQGLRFILTLGRGQNGPDIFVSVGRPTDPAEMVELMAWDRKAGGFNYYRSSGNARWAFAGNSRDALRVASRGKGPFESHPSGAVLMKELRSPWQNWDSPAAAMPNNIFPAGDTRGKHPWFTKRHPAGAIALEGENVLPANERWARARFATLRKNGGLVERPNQIIAQILGTPTANLITTHAETDPLVKDLDMPATFFLNTGALVQELELQAPPEFVAKPKLYANCLTKFDVKLGGKKRDTHFAFLTPEPAFEDQVVLREAIAIGLVSKRLAASLLMVDPWNPVYSPIRESLIRHCPPTATIADGKSSFSQDMANNILRAAKAGPPGTPEAEFAKRWATGAGFAAEFSKILAGYYSKITANLKTQAGFDAYFRLADTRREEFFKRSPIAREFNLLLPTTNIPAATRRMQRDATVAES